MAEGEREKLAHGQHVAATLIRTNSNCGPGGGQPTVSLLRTLRIMAVCSQTAGQSQDEDVSPREEAGCIYAAGHKVHCSLRQAPSPI